MTKCDVTTLIKALGFQHRVILQQTPICSSDQDIVSHCLEGKKMGVALWWTLFGLYRQHCKTTWATYLCDLHKGGGSRHLAWFWKCIFQLPSQSCELARWPFKSLQSVISHAPNFAESLGSDCFCNLHPAELLIGFGLLTALHVVGCQHY